MAGQDERDEDFDPWADLEPTENADADGGIEQPAEGQSDALVSGWLTDDAGGEGDDAAPLGVFVPDEESDVPEPAIESIEVDAAIDPIAGFELVDEVAPDAAIAEIAEPGDAGTEDPEPLPTVAVASEAAAPAPVARKTGGGVRRLAGVAGGGLLAIPVTLGILIWGLRQDPLNVVKHVPSSLAFLFPAELRRQEGRRELPPIPERTALVPEDVVVADDPSRPAPAPEVVAGELAEGSAAEAIQEPADPTAGPPGSGGESDEPVMPPADRPDATAAVEPGDAPGPAEPATPEPAAVPDPSIPDPAAVATLAPEARRLPDVPESPSPIVPPAEPEPNAPRIVEPAGRELPPLDFTPIDESAIAARAAFDALEAFDRDADAAVDPARRDRARAILLVDWYRRLAAVAEAYAGLERAAADGGRPLAGPPESVLGIQREIVADPTRLEQLARLSRNWFSYPDRQASGVMVPAVMAGRRQVGPYWCSTVTMAEADGRTRDLAVVSRSEPVAAPGDAVLVTGLIIAGDVVWAADVRPATREGLAAVTVDAAAESESAADTSAADPFSAPGP